MRNAIAYFSALIVFIGADALWLGTMTGRLYRPILGDVLLASPNLAAASIFYLLLPAGITLFAIAPALRDGNIWSAILLGAAFGFFTYATYDLTNQATLRNWTTTLTLIDLAWGSVLAALSSAGGYLLAARFG